MSKCSFVQLGIEREEKRHKGRKMDPRYKNGNRVTETESKHIYNEKELVVFEGRKEY